MARNFFNWNRINFDKSRLKMYREKMSANYIKILQISSHFLIWENEKNISDDGYVIKSFHLI
jgi:hypothetical protein